jgi:hypothetical protein
MVRLASPAAAAALLVLAGTAQARPQHTIAPNDQIILAWLPKLPAWVARTDVEIERVELLPGYWKCTVLCRRALNLYWFLIPLDGFECREIYIDQRIQ